MRSYKERARNVEAAAECKQAKQRKKRKHILIASAACASAVTLTAALVLFTPYTVGAQDLSAYTGSAYYTVIQTLSGQNIYRTNNFEAWFGGRKGAGWETGVSGVGTPDWGTNGIVPPLSPAEPDSPKDDSDDSLGAGSYEEVTNNQVAGVTEGDLFKRSDKYIFYLNLRPEESSDYRLEIYSIAGAASELSASYIVEPPQDSYFTAYGYSESVQLYLSEDCSQVTLILPLYRTNYSTPYTMLMGLDVSDPAHVTETSRIFLSGFCVSSRIAGNDLLLVNNFHASKNEFDEERKFLPQAGDFNDLKSIPAENIVCPEDAQTSAFTTVYALNKTTLELDGQLAFLSYSSDVYVSETALYLTHGTQQKGSGEYSLKYDYTATEIQRVAYKDGLALAGKYVAEGVVNDRYSMDEYEGVFRVFTTLTPSHVSYSLPAGASDPYTNFSLSRCNLRCFEISTGKIAGEVKHFAPAGERVRSARFMGNKAFVCTAVQTTDPVFAFDLSDYDKITYTDTGTISGYSLSLTSFSHETMLGIGVGDSIADLKIELYREGDGAVLSSGKYVAQNTNFSNAFKSYLIDRENSLIGLGVSTWDYQTGKYKTEYRLFFFDGEAIRLLVTVDLESKEYGTAPLSLMRAAVIDDYLYLLTKDGFVVTALK